MTTSWVSKLVGDERPQANGEIRLECPFDSHSSNGESRPFSINLSKRVARCFACGEAWAFHQLEERLNENNTANFESVHDPTVGFDGTGERATREEELPGSGKEYESVEEFWYDRGWDPAEVPTDWGEVIHGGNTYARIFSADKSTYQDRRVSGVGPRYKCREGGGGFFYVGDKASPITALVEGPIDALALVSAGIPHAATGYGADVSASERVAYELLPPRTILLCFDADFAGYKGMQSAKEALNKFGHRVLFMPIPDGFKDPAEVWQKDRDVAKEWVNDYLDEISSVGDVSYVKTLFQETSDTLPVYSTGLVQLDSLLRGGFRPGIHLVAAEPKAGKSALIQYWSRMWADSGYRVLQHSTELTKRQIWSRIVSPLVDVDWWEIEENPNRLTMPQQERVLKLAENLKVVVSTSIDEMAVASKGCDIVLLDYLQALDEVQDDPRLAVNKLLRVLTKLVIEEDKTIIVVSELGRHAYRRDRDGVKPQIDPTAFKETGRIEYACQSALSLMRGEGSELVQGHIMLNTRGPQGKFFMRAYLNNNTFEDFYPNG